MRGKDFTYGLVHFNGSVGLRPQEMDPYFGRNLMTYFPSTHLLPDRILPEYFYFGDEKAHIEFWWSHVKNYNEHLEVITQKNFSRQKELNRLLSLIKEELKAFKIADGNLQGLKNKKDLTLSDLKQAVQGPLKSWSGISKRLQQLIAAAEAIDNTLPDEKSAQADEYFVIPTSNTDPLLNYFSPANILGAVYNINPQLSESLMCHSNSTCLLYTSPSPRDRG